MGETEGSNDDGKQMISTRSVSYQVDVRLNKTKQTASFGNDFKIFTLNLSNSTIFWKSSP